jgi:hypothetical protein
MSRVSTFIQPREGHNVAVTKQPSFFFTWIVTKHTSEKFPHLFRTIPFPLLWAVQDMKESRFFLLIFLDKFGFSDLILFLVLEFIEMTDMMF